MGGEVFNRRMRGANGDDIFELAFLDYFCDVFREVFGDCDDAAMADRCVWAKEGCELDKYSFRKGL